MRWATLVITAAVLATGCSDPQVVQGPVELTVLDRGPVAGAEVYFLDPDGGEAAHLTTDARGKATAVVQRGGSVTVARFQPGTFDLWIVDTFTEVSPGDALVLDPTNILWGGSMAGEAQVTFPGAFEGATQYAADLGCTATPWSSAPEATAASFTDKCGAAMDGIALARDGADLVAWSEVTAVSPTGTLPDQAAVVSFGPWRSDLLTLQVTAINPPAESGSFTAFYTPRRNGRLFTQAWMGGAAALAPPQPSTVSFASASGFWTSAQLDVTVYDDAGSRGIKESEVTPASRTLDLGAILPPRLSGLALRPSAGGTTVTWTQSGPFGGQDGTLLTTDWTGPRGRLLWRVSLPPGRTSFDLPALPAAATPWGPAGGATLLWAGVASYDASAPVSTFRELQAAYGPLVESAPMRGPASIRWTSTLLAR